MGKLGKEKLEGMKKGQHEVSVGKKRQPENWATVISDTEKIATGRRY